MYQEGGKALDRGKGEYDSLEGNYYWQTMYRNLWIRGAQQFVDLSFHNDLSLVRKSERVWRNERSRNLLHSYAVDNDEIKDNKEKLK